MPDAIVCALLMRMPSAVGGGRGGPSGPVCSQYRACSSRYCRPNSDRNFTSSAAMVSGNSERK